MKDSRGAIQDFNRAGRKQTQNLSLSISMGLSDWTSFWGVLIWSIRVYAGRVFLLILDIFLLASNLPSQSKWSKKTPLCVTDPFSIFFFFFQFSGSSCYNDSYYNFISILLTVELNPYAAHVYFNRANLYASLRKYKDSEDDYTRGK